MSAPLQHVKAIFLDAVERFGPDEWSPYLDQACGDDADLRREVKVLLEAHCDGGGLIDAGAPQALLPLLAEGPGTVIGPYKLLEQIGEGGFGVVFMAEQTAPVRRRVALKVIKPGMDTRQVIARFEAERQALAMMEHPNIAKVFDAGTTGGGEGRGPRVEGQGSGTRETNPLDPGPLSLGPSTGRPYFVMELVRGVPITEYCDDRRLATAERLRLFVSVCQAVQHAHQKGIIHRDLKPSNVLVTQHDDQPVAKIIDFGIAKATCGPLTEHTCFTGFAQMLGSPMYMSPEQAALSGLDVDTRSDIYSLGVLLYELLTGETPFDKARLRAAAYDEMRRIIQEEEPPRPSARISTVGGVSTQTAARRDSDPQRLGRLIRGDLDWIVMKCLEKDRNRRYESASALARDIERHLAHEPVRARPPSAWYRFGKFARRKRAAFLVTTAAACAVLVGVVTLAVSNVMIRQEQARTEQARRLAERRADEVRQGLARLKQANALLDRGRWYAGERGWDDAHDAFTQAIQLHPEHVSVWVERGDLYTRLGLWDLAAADYAREMELHEPDTTLRWYQHALLRRAVGDEEGCRQTARAMRERFAGTLKDRFAEETVRSSLLVPDPAADLAQLIELSREAAPSRPPSMPHFLGTAHWRAGQYDEAVQRLQEALAAQPQWPIGWLSYPVLAMSHHRLGHETEARQALDEAARILDRWTQERYAGQSGHWVIHPGGEAAWPVPWWDYLECQLLYREARLLIDGAPPPDDARLHVLRARALAGLNWVEQAAAEFDAALQLSPDDPQIRLEAHRNRGGCCVHRRQWRDAAAEFAKAAELRPDEAILWRFRAVAHFADGDVDAHRQTCTAMLERFALTEDRFAAANVLLACVLRDDVLPDMARLLPLTRVSDPIWHWGAGVRGAALYRAGRYDECVQCFETSATKYRRRAWDWCFLAMAHHRLGHADEARRCLSEATRWIDAASQHTEDDPTGTEPVWSGWHEPAVAPLLLREAEELLEEP